MRKLTYLIVLILIASMILSSCSLLGDLGGINPGNNEGNSDKNDEGSDNESGTGKDDSASDDGENSSGIGSSQTLDVRPFPATSFTTIEKQGVIGAILQTGDGNAYVTGTVPSPESTGYSLMKAKALNSITVNQQLVTMEHNFGHTCCVSGYIGNSLYIIQDFGSLAWNKKGIGHKDGTVLLEYGDTGYFSISAISENKIIVGNPTDSSVESLWDSTDSYLFGYMVYDEESKQITPMYEENNLRFYTASYFINGVALVSVKNEDGEILFGVIDSEGNYVVEPQYEMMADEAIDDLVIVALNAESESEYTDNCGRYIYYDSTLMVNVQNTRSYECKSQSVGLINVKTGEIVLECDNAYAGRVLDDSYFVINNNGEGFLFNTKTKERTAVESGIYFYFDNEWMLYSDADGNIYLSDDEFNLYDASELYLGYPGYYIENGPRKLVNLNIPTSTLNSAAKGAYYVEGETYDITVECDYVTDEYFSHYTITVGETGDVISGATSYTPAYNGGFLYTMENSVYRYDIKTGTVKKIETGYGDFTEEFYNDGTKYYTELSQLDVGLYLLRYYAQESYGRGYLMIILNDKGEVLFDTAINSVERLNRNYLGVYDEALYELAGSTDISDNYLLTRTDGSHFLIQFVRGEPETVETEEPAEPSYTRVISDISHLGYLSPFKLNFKDGSEITVIMCGETLSSDYYVYDSETQSLKMIKIIGHGLFDTNNFIEINVISSTEMVTLKIEKPLFAYEN